MTERILLIGDDDTLKPINSAPYVKEDVLWSLLERYPDLKRSCREDFGNRGITLVELLGEAGSFPI